MERHFDDELIEQKKRLLWMADTAQEMVRLAVDALLNPAAGRSEEVLIREDQVNQQEVLIHEETIRLLAVRQPAAGDLRLLIAILKINANLERVADQAVNIVELSATIRRRGTLFFSSDILGLARCAEEMVRDAIRAFIHHDTEMARSVIRRDDTADAMNLKTFKELVDAMISDHAAIAPGVPLILVARALERVADHATNICEEVVFIEEGRTVRHHFRDEESRKSEDVLR